MTKLKINPISFRKTPQRQREIDINQYVLSPDWLNDLIALCRPATKQQFQKHIGPESNYAGKMVLLESLKFHYGVLSGALSQIDPVFNLSIDQKAAAICKLNEEITACSPGYHGRVNALLESYFLPKTLEELFSAIRHEIVEHAAILATNEVHTNNRFFEVASQKGYGVYPKLENDPYRGGLSDREIELQLTQAFSDNFQPFSTLLYLKDLLATPFDKYHGRNEDGYPSGTYLPGLEYLRLLFDDPAIDYTYVLMNEDTGVVYDINWGKILGRLWGILLEKKYIDFSTRTNYLRTLGFESAGFVTEFVLGERAISRAMRMVGKLFDSPCVKEQDVFKNIAYLFSSETECFAYLRCNPGLSSEDIISLLLRMMKIHQDHKPVLQSIWQFAAEQPSWSSLFKMRYFEKYSRYKIQLERQIASSPFEFYKLIHETHTGKLKGFFLKLQGLDQTLLADRLEEMDCLLLCLLACNHRIEEIRALFQLLKPLP